MQISKGGQTSSALIKMPADEDNIETEQTSMSPISRSEHFIPYLMKFMFDNKLGVLPSFRQFH